MNKKYPEMTSKILPVKFRFKNGELLMKILGRAHWVVAKASDIDPRVMPEVMKFLGGIQ